MEVGHHQQRMTSRLIAISFVCELWPETQ